MKSLSNYLAEVRVGADRTTAVAVIEVVVLYRIASTINLAPLKFVAGELDVSVSTATHIMAKARQHALTTDLITRETYNRLHDERQRLLARQQVPGGAARGSIDRALTPLRGLAANRRAA